MKTLAVVSALAAIACPSAAWSQTHGDELKAGQYLKTNEWLQAKDGKSFAIIQRDGNLCVYNGSNPGNKKGEIWCSGKAPGAGDYFLVMQGDANLCVYRGTGPDDNKGYVWCSAATSRPNGDYRVSLACGGLTVYSLVDAPQGFYIPLPPQVIRIWGTKPSKQGFGC